MKETGKVLDAVVDEALSMVEAEFMLLAELMEKMVLVGELELTTLVEELVVETDAAKVRDDELADDDASLDIAELLELELA